MSRLNGCMMSLGVALLLLVGGFFALLVAFVDAYGCSPVPARDESAWRGVAEDLDAALAASPGVQASRVEFTTGSCSASTRAEATFRISATLEEVAEVAQLVAETRRRQGDEAALTSATFEFDGTGLDESLRGDGLFLDERVPVDDMVAEARAWATLSRQYPGTSAWVSGRAPAGPDPGRHIVVPLRDAGTPGAVTEAFRSLERAPFPPSPRSDVTWDVQVIRNSEFVDGAAVPYNPDITSYRTLGSAPPDDVLAAMERIAGWPALLGPPDGLAAYVEWKAHPRDGAPPHLAIVASLRLDELWRVPGDQVEHVGPTTPAPGLAAAILRDIEASGQPFALSVSAGYPILDVHSWSQ
jgi:hypothetical protein